MRLLTNELKASLCSETTSLCKCWRLTRTDGNVFRFTDHDMPVCLASEVYEPFLGFSSSAISANATLAPDNLDVSLLLDHETLTEADLASGAWDGALVDIWLVDWLHPDRGGILLAGGWSVGEVTRGRNQFTAELRSKAQRLQQSIGKVYSQSCRATLGDQDCGVDLVAFTVSGTVTSASTASTFTDSTRTEPSGYFTYGLLTWTSGNNRQRHMEVKHFAGGAFDLFEAMPEPIRTGDAYTLTAGCDKSLSQCRSRFTNALNFRGEPFIPGADAIAQVIVKADTLGGQS